jgi:hypothetical protein
MTAMTEEWVSLWYQCLGQNIDYSLYCNARTAGDNEKCQEFESRFDRVEEIYDDFGAMDGWPDAGMKSELWKDWFEPRRHLFMDTAREVVHVQQYVPRQGYLLLDVPLQASASETAALVNEFLAAYYDDHSVVRATRPKYMLNCVDGRPVVGLQRTRQACRSVARSYRYDLETLEELRHVDAVAAFARHEIDNMGWTLDPRARQQLMETGKLSDERLESFKVMLNKCRRDFKLLAANTIRGSFPNDQPFESEVLDIF